eukprot:TRINITY_DN2740_c0_g1_i1.p1 TRINITY_DN2740_c0_g1~~TRINITY_DN2740_c0_g1_i1.p1  ORF type:complete len:361 (-),score=62.79 TRINITY_DN2740_c0_g1_i1:48-1130(-)
MASPARVRANLERFALKERRPLFAARGTDVENLSEEFLAVLHEDPAVEAKPNFPSVMLHARLDQMQPDELPVFPSSTVTAPLPQLRTMDRPIFEARPGTASPLARQVLQSRSQSVTRDHIRPHTSAGTLSAPSRARIRQESTARLFTELVDPMQQDRNSIVEEASPVAQPTPSIVLPPLTPTKTMTPVRRSSSPSVIPFLRAPRAATSVAPVAQVHNYVEALTRASISIQRRASTPEVVSLLEPTQEDLRAAEVHRLMQQVIQMHSELVRLTMLEQSLEDSDGDKKLQRPRTTPTSTRQNARTTDVVFQTSPTRAVGQLHINLLREAKLRRGYARAFDVQHPSAEDIATFSATGTKAFHS